jgi:hypothetical protein
MLIFRQALADLCTAEILNCIIITWDGKFSDVEVENKSGWPMARLGL